VTFSSFGGDSSVCVGGLDAFMNEDPDSVKMFHYNFTSTVVTQLSFANGQEAANLLNDPDTNVVRIGECSPEAKSVVWLYPDTTGDHGVTGDKGLNGAFLIGSGECERMENAIQYAREEVTCLAIYRLPTVPAMKAVLERFHGIGTIAHAVIGGHGSDSRVDQGELWLSNIDNDDIFQSDMMGIIANGPESTLMLTTLQVRLTPLATIMIDSCYAGVNGVAKTVSTAIPEHWVFGGVVSLTSAIQLHPTPFTGGLNGPARVVSEWAPATVLSWPKVLNGCGYPNCGGSGLSIFKDAGSNSLNSSLAQNYMGERLVGWLGGTNHGSVTQWMYPSMNNRTITTGAKVQIMETLTAYRMEMGQTGQTTSLNIFPSPLPILVFSGISSGLNGTVITMMNVGEVVTSGNAIIQFELPPPDVFPTSDDCGSTSGPVIVMIEDFHKLMVKD
jgi:hypothetical protein